MPHITTALFDLDGTLTDPAEGITHSIQHALAQLDRPPPAGADLCAYIGPPLRQTFATLLATHDAALVEQAMALYRERFAAVGLFENQLYDGVHAMLADLKRHSIQLFVATSKPRVYAQRIVAHFGLNQYVTGVYGSELDGRYDDKGELLTHLVDTERLAAPATLMIGDRQHDILAARQHDMPSIGVTYGYGTIDELLDAGADWICATPREVAACIRENGTAASTT